MNVLHWATKHAVSFGRSVVLIHYHPSYTRSFVWFFLQNANISPGLYYFLFHLENSLLLTLPLLVFG